MDDESAPGGVSNRSPSTITHIIGAHKSGSSLLRALLDGHPELDVLPFESHVGANLGWRSRYPLRPTFKRPTRSRRTLAGRLSSLLNLYLTTGDPTADARLVRLYDCRPIESALAGPRRPARTSDLIEWYLGSGLLASTGAIRTTHWVEKSVEQSAMVPKLNKQPWKSKFILIERDAGENLATLYRRSAKLSGRLTISKKIRIVESLRRNHARGLEWERSPAIDCHRLAYEDLTADPESAMKELAAFLGISFDRCLLLPTSGGRPWSGNSSKGVAFAGVSGENALSRTALDPMQEFFVELVNTGVVPRKVPSRREGENRTAYLVTRAYIAALRMWLMSSRAWPGGRHAV